MEAVWISTLIVAIAEIGDRTQLLAIVLAARFRRPLPIIAGIFVATVLNHAVAAGLGAVIADWLEGRWFQIGVGLAFIAMGLWALVPDDEEDGGLERSRHGVFLTTLIAFFLVEIGDKTQIATSLLAARYEQVLTVTLGTTIGMMLANVPAVYLGEAATKVVPLHVVRMIAAGLFGVIGLWIIVAALIGG